MIFGLLFILAGFLIVMYPPLLSIIVAVFLISIGLSLISMHFYFKKASREFDNPFFNFFIRF
ncbi:MAG: DUF3096 domain-containing protein [Candidatus Omnitrophota bacterium]